MGWGGRRGGEEKAAVTSENVGEKTQADEEAGGERREESREGRLTQERRGEVGIAQCLCVRNMWV